MVIFEKKPARGGIPAIENSTRVKLITKVQFLKLDEVQLAINAGKLDCVMMEKINRENSKTVNME